jgi:hypothetical protein
MTVSNCALSSGINISGIGAARSGRISRLNCREWIETTHYSHIVL